jgi:Outer membrane protein beta-barrel domain
MKKILVITLSFMLCVSFVNAQVVLEKDAKADTLVPSFGKNRFFYMHNTIGYGVNILNQSNAYETELPGSGNFMFGYTFKWKVSNFFAFGFDLMWNSYDYQLKQDDNKLFPDSLTHDKQKIMFNDISVSPYIRINFDVKRGNYLGYYLDLGGYGAFHLNRKLYTKDILSSEEVSKTYISKYKALEKYNYGLYARLGFNTVTVFAKYRMSELLIENGVNDLPPLTVGLQWVIPY